MFPHGGSSWSNNVYTPDTTSPFPRDPRTAARALPPNPTQTFDAVTGWTPGWSQPAQWPYPCPPAAMVRFQNWVPNVAPQPGVNCPPIGIPPPGGAWSNYTGESGNTGSAEKKSTEQGSHEVNGLAEGTSDLSLFLSNYCNPKQIRHLVSVPVSPANEVKDVAEAKSCEMPSPAVTQIPLEKILNEEANGMPIETLVNASRKTNGAQPTESSVKPIHVEVEGLLLTKGDPAISMKRKVVLVEQTENIPSNSGKRLLLETSSFSPSLEGNAAQYVKLESAPGNGKIGPLAKRDSDSKSASSGESQENPGCSTSTWAAKCRERGMTLVKEQNVSNIEKRTSPGKAGRTASNIEKQTSMWKWEPRFSSCNSRERGTSLGQSEHHVTSMEDEVSLGKPDRTSTSKEPQPSIENQNWAAHGMEKATSLEKTDSTLIMRGSRELYTPESPGKIDVRSDNLFVRTGETGGGGACVSHQILGNIGTQKASDMSAHRAEGVAGSAPDPRTAAILAKKEEIEREYEQNCKTFFLVAAMMLEQEPSIQQTMVSALKKTLREVGKNCVKELENFIQRYDEHHRRQ